jgi:hypothetical protein
MELLRQRVSYPPASWSPPELDRLRRFHLHYGEEVLAAARAGRPGWRGGDPRVDRGQSAAARRRLAPVYRPPACRGLRTFLGGHAPAGPTS